jgi:uncharacterized protein
MPGFNWRSCLEPGILTEINAKRTTIESLCRKYGVASLDVFGSATRADWRPEASDIDFIVEFQSGAATPGHTLVDRYLGLAEELEHLFGRSVDLVTARSIRNPYLRRSVDASRVQLYAA